MNRLQRGPRTGRALAGLEVIEDVIYAIIALFLIGSGVLLLLGAGIDISKNFDVNNIHPLVVRVLDETLLVFMVVELLHTVRITLRDHTLAAEPFLIVGLDRRRATDTHPHRQQRHPPQRPGLRRLLGAAPSAHRPRGGDGRRAVHLAPCNSPRRLGRRRRPAVPATSQQVVSLLQGTAGHHRGVQFDKDDPTPASPPSSGAAPAQAGPPATPNTQPPASSSFGDVPPPPPPPPPLLPWGFSDETPGSQSRSAPRAAVVPWRARSPVSSSPASVAGCSAHASPVRRRRRRSRVPARRCCRRPFRRQQRGRHHQPVHAH